MMQALYLFTHEALFIRAYSSGPEVPQGDARLPQDVHPGEDIGLELRRHQTLIGLSWKLALHLTCLSGMRCAADGRTGVLVLQGEPMEHKADLNDIPAPPRTAWQCLRRSAYRLTYLPCRLHLSA